MDTPQNSGPQSAEQSGARPTGDRLTNLELLFMHLERQVAELSQMVLQHTGQIERLQRDLQRLQRVPERRIDDGPESDEPSWDQ